jgi:hypothetical protein
MAVMITALRVDLFDFLTSFSDMAFDQKVKTTFDFMVKNQQHVKKIDF